MRSPPDLQAKAQEFLNKLQELFRQGGPIKDPGGPGILRRRIVGDDPRNWLVDDLASKLATAACHSLERDTISRVTGDPAATLSP